MVPLLIMATSLVSKINTSVAFLKGWVNSFLAFMGQLYLGFYTIRAVIAAYNRFQLPKYWGTGKRASADGTKWEMYEQNLLAEYHIRYGGYGGIGYYHVSDTYIALFSHFIPCGVCYLDGMVLSQLSHFIVIGRA